MYAGDLPATVRAQVRQLQAQEYDLKRRALHEVIVRKLLEREVAGLGLTVDALLERGLDSKLGEPADAEVEAFYLAQRERLNRPFPERANVAVPLSPPKVEVRADPRRVRGNPDAPVTIVEFSDFQCRFCLRQTWPVESRQPDGNCRRVEPRRPGLRDLPRH